MNLLKQFEQTQIQELSKDKTFPEFKAGDTIKVNVRIVDGENIRIQAYQGVVIARRSRGLGSSFIVRKISHGEGVERKFLLYSPNVENIEVMKRGVVRRSKLYYLRKLQGKAARIKEKIMHKKSK